MLFSLQHVEVPGAAKETIRDAGIVLKEMTDEGPRFEGEEAEPSDRPDETAQPSPGEAVLDALPSEAETASTESALPQIPTLGVNSLKQGELAGASEMIRGGGPNKAIGGEATVSVYGVEGVGNKFVYVFDRSISMQGAPLRSAKRELIASLAALERTHQFQIIFFNHEPVAWDLTGGQNRIAFASDGNKRLAEQFVRGITSSGGTYRKIAIRMALGLRPDVIFFLTDADDPMPQSDIAETIRRAQRNATAINTIEFGLGPRRSRENFLTQLARETGGGYLYVDTRGLAE